MNRISKSLIKIIQNFTTYNLTNDERLPTSICPFCKISVYRANKENKVVKLPDYSQFKFPLKSTRSNVENLCTCTLCELARQNGLQFRKKNVTKELIVKKVCTKCLSELGKGKTHNSVKSTKVKNVINGIERELTMSEQEHLACKIIDKKVPINNKELKLSRSHGKPMQIQLRSKTRNNSNQNVQISTDDMLKIKLNLGLSANDSKKLASSV